MQVNVYSTETRTTAELIKKKAASGKEYLGLRFEQPTPMNQITFWGDEATLMGMIENAHAALLQGNPRLVP